HRAQRLAAGVEDPLEERIEAAERGSGEGEALGVPHLGEAGDVASAIGEGAVGAAAEDALAFQAPAAEGRGADGAPALHHVLPERAGVERSGEHAALADDGDGGEGHRELYVIAGRARVARTGLSARCGARYDVGP